MPHPRGQYIPLSLARRMIGDFLHYGQRIPLAHGEQRFDLSDLKAAVAKARPRPSWQAIFFKAWAIVAAERPVLRRIYVGRPWARLYEHPVNIGAIVVSRPLEGDQALHHLPIHVPEQATLVELDRKFTHARLAPVAEIPAFRRQILQARLPFPLRRAIYDLGMNWMGRWKAKHLGTFGMSCVASLGGATLTTIAPWTTMIHYTPFAPDGSLMMRVALDHRVLDGVEASIAFHELRRTLDGPIMDEVVSLRRAAAAA